MTSDVTELTFQDLLLIRVISWLVGRRVYDAQLLEPSEKRLIYRVNRGFRVILYVYHFMWFYYCIVLHEPDVPS